MIRLKPRSMSTAQATFTSDVRPGRRTFRPRSGAIQRQHRGGKVDWWIVKLSPSGALLAGTLLGGQGNDNPGGIRFTAQGELCLFGQTIVGDRWGTAG